MSGDLLEVFFGRRDELFHANGHITPVLALPRDVRHDSRDSALRPAATARIPVIVTRRPWQRGGERRKEIVE